MTATENLKAFERTTSDAELLNVSFKDAAKCHRVTLWEAAPRRLNTTLTFKDKRERKMQTHLVF